MLLLSEGGTEDGGRREAARGPRGRESGGAVVPPPGSGPSRSRATWLKQGRRFARRRQMSRLSRALRRVACGRALLVDLCALPGHRDRAAARARSGRPLRRDPQHRDGPQRGHRLGRRNHDRDDRVCRARDRRALVADPRARRAAFDAVKYVGAAYLFVLGVRRLLGRGLESPDEEAPPRTRRRAYTQGVFVNLTNPKTIVFIFAFLPQFVDPQRAARLGAGACARSDVRAARLPQRQHVGARCRDGRRSPARLDRDRARPALGRRQRARRPRDPRRGVDAEPSAVTIRDLRPEDWPTVRAIYEEGIRGGDATFETEAPTWEAWDAAHPELRLVAERDGAVVGWAALSPSSARHCYRGVGEVSVYVAAGRARCRPRSRAARRARRALGAGGLLDADGRRVSRRTRRRLGSTRRAASARSASVRGSARPTASGATSSGSSAARRWSAGEVPVRRLPVGAREPRARARALSRGSHPGRVVPRRRRRSLRSLGRRTRGATRCRRRRSSPPRRARRASATMCMSSRTEAGRAGAALVAAASLRARRLRRPARRDRRLGRRAARRRGGDRAGRVRPARAERRHHRCGRDRAAPRRSVTRARGRPHRQPLARRAERDRRPARPDPRRGERSWNEPLPNLPDGELAVYCGSGVTACVTLHRAWLAERRAASIRARGVNGHSAACRSSAGSHAPGYGSIDGGTGRPGLAA